MKQPQRHIEFGLRISADTKDDLISALNQILFEVETRESLSVASGGYGSGYNCEMQTRTNEGVTHESYFEDVVEWLKNNKKQEAEQSAP